MLIRFTIIFFLIAYHCHEAVGQQSESQPDTTILKELKQYPRKNTLPVRRPVIFPETVRLPEPAALELSINYWRTWTAFGVNINQASFSENWGGGGVNSMAFGGQYSYKTDYCSMESLRTKTSYPEKLQTGYFGIIRLRWNCPRAGIFSVPWISNRSLTEDFRSPKMLRAMKLEPFFPGLWLPAT